MYERQLQILLFDRHHRDVASVRAALDQGAVPGELVHRDELDEASTIAHRGTFDCALVSLSADDGLGPLEHLRSRAPSLPLVALVDDASALGPNEPARTLLRNQLDAANLLRAIGGAIETYVPSRVVAGEGAAFGPGVRPLLELLEEGVLIVGPDDQLRFANATARELLGRMLQAPFRLPRECDDFEVQREDGAFRRIRIRSTAITWDGHPARAISLRDRTNALRASELAMRLAQSDRLAALGRLAGGIAHEINNPAALLAANVEFLKDRLTDSDATEVGADSLRDLLLDCRDAIARISTIVTDLRACSHVASDQVTAVDLNDVVEAACARSGGSAALGNIILKLRDTMPPIAGHRTKLVQAVGVLMANAARAALHSGSGVTVSTDVDLDNVILAIGATHDGVARALRDHVLDPFFHPLSAGNRRGLSLALANEIVRVHRGEILMQSQGGTVRRFEVRLPIERGLSLPRPRPFSPPPRDRPRRKLLLIDDEPAFLRAMARLLHRHFDVVTAPGGAEALAARPAEFDVVVCDLMMPRVDGPSFYRQLHQTSPEAVGRVVFTTGGAFSEEVRRFLDVVPNPVLNKPFTSKELGEAIERLLTSPPVSFAPNAEAASM